MGSEFIEQIQLDLEKNADEDYRNTIRDHFQMDVENFMGVKTPVIRKIANNHFDSKREIDDTLVMCEELLKTGVYEHKIIAFQWAYKCKKQYLPQHFDVFEHWLETYVNDWSDCDDLCINALGEFLFRYPEYTEKLKGWAVSKNQWVRRGSAVSLIFGLRKGLHLDIALEISDTLMDDEEDLVRKATGWMLKEAGKSFQKEVFDYLMGNKPHMPRLTLRYAAEKLPPELKEKVMSR